MLWQGILLNFPENLKGEDDVTLALVGLAKKADYFGQECRVVY